MGGIINLGYARFPSLICWTRAARSLLDSDFQLTLRCGVRLTRRRDGQSHFMTCKVSISPPQAISMDIMRFIFHARVTRFHSWSAPAHQKVPELHHVLDDAKYWFDRLLTRTIIGASAYCPQLMRHPGDSIGTIGQCRRLRPTLHGRWMMFVPFHRHQRFDSCRKTSIHIGHAEEAGIAQ